MIRGGLWGSHVQTFYDIPYVSYVLAIVTLIGLWLMRDVRKHLVLG
jgi:ABC-type polysaccharide/polyol phosphate export permease